MPQDMEIFVRQPCFFQDFFKTVLHGPGFQRLIPAQDIFPVVPEFGNEVHHRGRKGNLPFGIFAFRFRFHQYGFRRMPVHVKTLHRAADH